MEVTVIFHCYQFFDKYSHFYLPSGNWQLSPIGVTCNERVFRRGNAKKIRKKVKTRKKRRKKGKKKRKNLVWGTLRGITQILERLTMGERESNANFQKSESFRTFPKFK